MRFGMAMSGSGASYGDCVASLRSSLNYLESSVQTLDSGVSDFPRLVNVLKSVRVCVLATTYHNHHITHLVVLQCSKQLTSLIALRTHPTTHSRCCRSLSP